MFMLETTHQVLQMLSGELHQLLLVSQPLVLGQLVPLVKVSGDKMLRV
jgi:hypothetical protein